MDLVFIYTLRSKPRRETEGHNPVIPYHITRHSTHEYFALLKSYRGVAWRLTRAVGFLENFPKAKLTPARFCFSVCSYLLFLHSQHWLENSQETLRDVCDSFQRPTCNSTSKSPGNPEQPQSSWLSAQWEPRLPGGVKEILSSHQQQEIFLQSTPKPFIHP